MMVTTRKTKPKFVWDKVTFTGIHLDLSSYLFEEYIYWMYSNDEKILSAYLKIKISCPTLLYTYLTTIKFLLYSTNNCIVIYV